MAEHRFSVSSQKSVESLELLIWITGYLCEKTHGVDEWLSQVKENKSQSFTFHPSSLRRQLLFVSATTASMSFFFGFVLDRVRRSLLILFGPNKTNRQTERQREAHMNKMSDWMREMTQNGRFALSTGSSTAPLHCRGSCCIRQL